MKIKILLFLSVLLVFNFSFSQIPFPENGELFRDDVVPRIDIKINSSDLAKILDDQNLLSDDEYPATFIFDNGNIRDTILNVGFRLRGNTSRWSAKKSFKVSFNTFESGRKYYGVEKLNLNGEHNDPSIVRSKLCADIAKEMGVIGPRANHVRFYINDEFKGLYINVEHIDEEFMNTRFGSKDGNLYKCLYPADLAYKGENPESYKYNNSNGRVYDLKTNNEADDYSDLANLIHVLKYADEENFPCEIETIFNVESYLKSLVFDILTGNWDNYVFNKNNFYLYDNPKTGKFEYVIYDLDNTFGIDWFNIKWQNSNIYSWPTQNESRPLYQRIMSVPKYKSMFTKFMQEALDNVYYPIKLNSYLDNKRNLIKTIAASDTYRVLDYGFTYIDFYYSYEKDIDYHHVSTNIKDFISQRYNSASYQINQNYLLPSIVESHIYKSDKFYFTAGVDNPELLNSISCYYDNNNDGLFELAEMNDDGIGNDVASGDNIFSTGKIDFIEGENLVKYYFLIYNNTGDYLFYPGCFPDSFFVYDSNISLAINEFMADNDNIFADENGDFDDWLEIYNYGQDSIFLGDKYLTDAPGIKDKWQMPKIWIHSGEFLIFWADDDEDQGIMHTNFKLSANGEYIGIFDSQFQKIDEVTFGTQQTDKSTGRIPDGKGDFTEVTPTPGYPNMPNLIVENNFENDILIYPNPVKDILNIELLNRDYSLKTISLYDMIGRKLNSINNVKESTIQIDFKNYPSGIYYINISKRNSFERKIIKISKS